MTFGLADDAQGPLREYSKDSHVVEPVMKLEFTLDDKRLVSTEGVTGTFVLPITDLRLTFEGDEPAGLHTSEGCQHSLLNSQ